MKTNVLCRILFILVTAFLTACQQAQHSFFSQSDDSPEAASTLQPGNPDQAGAATENRPQMKDMTTPCSEFLSTVSVLDMNATEDRVIDKPLANGVIKAPLRNVSVYAPGGHYRIESAVYVDEVQMNGGDIMINANEIGDVSATSGNLCLGADKISSVSVNGSSVHVIIANEVGSLSLEGSGIMHVYDSVVQEMKPMVGASAGYVCLHGKAQILNLNGFPEDRIRRHCSL